MKGGVSLGNSQNYGANIHSPSRTNFTEVQAVWWDLLGLVTGQIVPIPRRRFTYLLTYLLTSHPHSSTKQIKRKILPITACTYVNPRLMNIYQIKSNLILVNRQHLR